MSCKYVGVNLDACEFEKDGNGSYNAYNEECVFDKDNTVSVTKIVRRIVFSRRGMSGLGQRRVVAEFAFLFGALCIVSHQVLLQRTLELL